MEVHSWEEAPDGDRTVDNRAAVVVVVIEADLAVDTAHENRKEGKTIVVAEN